MSKPRPPRSDHLHLGCFFPAGQTTFLLSDEAVRRTPPMTRKNLVAFAEEAELVGFDSLFIADNWSGHQRISEESKHQGPSYHAALLAMALFAVTENIGVISTIHTSYHHPAHVARMGATLDAFSGGRWGWNIVTGFLEQEALLFGDTPVEHDERYRRAAEFVDVVKLFWSEFEPIDHKGEYYSAAGRLKAPRPVQQPHPFLINAGASPAGSAFAARYADMMLMMAENEDRVREVDARLEALTAPLGRSVSTSAFCVSIVREGEGEAEEEWDRLTASINMAATKELAADIVGGVESMQDIFAKMGEDEAARTFGSAGSTIHLVGTAEQVADKLISLKQNTHATGAFINFPLWSAAELQTFAPVLPHLLDAGIWQPPHTRGYSW